MNSIKIVPATTKKSTAPTSLLETSKVVNPSMMAKTWFPGDGNAEGNIFRKNG